MYASPPPPHYAMLDNNQYYPNSAYPPPAYHRKAPHYPYYRRNSCLSSCCRCICCCFCFLFFLIFILGILFFSMYHFYDPKIPSYKVEGLTVKSFDIQPDFSLNTEFEVTVRAENPNKNIGFIYGKDSTVDVMYSDTNLCSGKLPAFEQGHENVTIMQVDLKGKSEFGSGLQQAFMNNRNSHKIPLLVKVKAPVSVVIGEIPLREFKVYVNCSLLVDNLSPNKDSHILSKETTFNIVF
ncbi:hypothetical protein CDL12_21173 [Handroanthus impetiginosus]|uniref:Late embryogenesis abundant protein LEA-2 subgroup domain-containing protein n=1 Tax=Handroanthus impetiginosus TaxID=429701 RepID=A0A2G9GLY7_9LAMI|nr:hypothetical protein CDL12_27884 [Handroanthus impetiginosus]PIN06273.1 hypothetical protein CDL12_21173 [Handroanthus impetiginosus]